MAENKGYMQRYAMLFGTYMGVFWISKFILFPIGLSVPFLLFLFMGLTLCVPFMGYYYARMYRNHVCGGGISFLHAWIFTVFMYIFAALLAAVAHYIYSKKIGVLLLKEHMQSIYLASCSREKNLSSLVQIQPGLPEGIP